MLSQRSSTSLRVLLTGASRGIGRATARALVRRGHRVVLAAREMPALRDLAAELNRGPAQPASYVQLDVTSDVSVAEAIEQTFASGPLDVLINNAGSCDQRPFLCQPPAIQYAEMDLNFFGPLRMMRAALPQFCAQGRGAIIQVSSLLGTIPAPTTANYSATKAALEAFTVALRGELAGTGVRLCTFVAPHTQTEMGERVRFAGVVSLSPEYVAERLVTCSERAPNVYAGSPVYQVLLRLARWFPEMMRAQLKKSALPALELARAGEHQRSRQDSDPTQPQR